MAGFLLLVQLINILEKAWIEGCFPVSVYVPVLCTVHQWLDGDVRKVSEAVDEHQVDHKPAVCPCGSKG